MGKPKFTPGPWLHTETLECGVAHVSNGPRGFGNIATIWTVYENADANAALIAAAPDLYEALREANAFILAPAEDIKDGVTSRIRAALAKARGEA